MSDLNDFTDQLIDKGSRGTNQQSTPLGGANILINKSLNQSFTEIKYAPRQRYQQDFTEHLRSSIDAGLPKETAAKLRQKSQFHDLTISLVSKIGLYEIKVTEQDRFPFLVYDIESLKQALDRYKLQAVTRSNFRALLRSDYFKKAFLYVFWIFMALKFKDHAFGNYDHFSPVDQIFKDQQYLSGKEKYNLKNEDLELGRQRRISFIQYWRVKFQANMMKLRRENASLLIPNTQDMIPFIFGEAIIICFENNVRFGKQIIEFGDPKCS